MVTIETKFQLARLLEPVQCEHGFLPAVQATTFQVSSTKLIHRGEGSSNKSPPEVSYSQSSVPQSEDEERKYVKFNGTSL